ncbi:MAG: hypothetical protein H0U71_09040 [Gammaproteobacteria bacterium]|nr:hypothetical protein [Gammaproteobacteria bacterium]
MLRKINEGGVESENGFSIQIVGPELLEYKEKNKIIKIDITYDPKKRKIYICASNIDELSKNEKIQMIRNIKKAIKLLKGNFEVV